MAETTIRQPQAISCAGQLRVFLRTGSDLAGRSIMAEFWSRAGETPGIPRVFAAAVEGSTKGMTCVGCSHSHYLTTPVAAVGVAGASV